MDKLILFIIIIQLSICDINFPIEQTNEYELFVLNENGGNNIEIKPGTYTKIIFQLKPVNNLMNNYFKFLNDSNSTLEIEEDSNIISKDRVIILDTNKDLVYSTYIGLRCNHKIKTKKFKLNININTTSNKITMKSSPEININTSKNKINLKLVMNKMPINSLNYFKITNELYNVEEISFEIRKEIENLDFEEIKIEPFFKRKEISKNNPENNGILFKFPLKYDDEDEEEEEKRAKIDAFRINFKLDIDEDNQKCFEIEGNDFNLEINKNNLPEIDESVKETIKYYMKDQTDSYDKTFSLKLNTFFEVSPAIFSCEFKKNSSDTGKIYKNFIDKSGYYDIIINDLDNFDSYFANCELSDTNIEKGKIKKVQLTIGNVKDSDFNHDLIPSRDENLLSQCVNFTFMDDNSYLLLKLKGENFCKYIMKKNEEIALQSMETVLCKSFFPPNDIDLRYGTICVAALPDYNKGDKVKGPKKEEEFNKKFDEFISNIKDSNIKVKKHDYGKLINIKESNRIYDSDINPLSIISSIVKEEFSSKIYTFTLNVLSNHIYPVQCFYNKILDEKSNIFLLSDSVILMPKENLELVVRTNDDITENTFYSVNFRCYNYLGFDYRYKSTGDMTMYTYYSKNDNYDQLINDDIVPTTLEINCNEKQNQQNPRCLVDDVVPLANKFQTDIPDIIKDIKDKALSFAAMCKEYQKQFLNDIVETINTRKTSDFKLLIDETISALNYMTNTDCSLLSSGLTNNLSETYQNELYVNCRKLKQTNMASLIEDIKTNLECPNLIKLIDEGLGDNLEDSLKKVLFLINEMSNNPDSYQENLSKILYDVSICLQDKFDEYWSKVEEYLLKIKKFESSTLAVKKDVLFAIMRILTNLAKTIHFEEMDGYSKGKKTKTGLLFSDDGEKIQNKIIKFAKKFNYFNDSLYQFSSSTILQVETNKGLGEEYDSEELAINIPNKNIIIIIYSNYLLRINNAKYLQLIVFDSPLVSIKTNGDEKEASDSINNFINIILYDEKNNEIPIKKINEKYKPKILYLKEKYKSLEKCFYYDEEEKDLKTEGVEIDVNYKYNGVMYIKCDSSHLTAFTAGTYNFNSNLQIWAVCLIVLIILIVLISFVVTIKIIKKRRRAKFYEIDSCDKFGDGRLDEIIN